MNTRHNGHRFAVTTVSVMRDRDSEQIILVRINGFRMIGGQANPMVCDAWEWDRTRDPMVPLMETLIAEVDGARYRRSAI